MSQTDIFISRFAKFSHETIILTHLFVLMSWYKPYHCTPLFSGDRNQVLQRFESCLQQVNFYDSGNI